MTILLKGRILPIGEVASRRVSACSLRSRLVFNPSLTLISSTWVVVHTVAAGQLGAVALGPTIKDASG